MKASALNKTSEKCDIFETKHYIFVIFDNNFHFFKKNFLTMQKLLKKLSYI